MGRSYYGTGSGSLTADPALKNVTKSFGGGEAFNFNSGNKVGGMDPLSAGLGLASAGLGFISGIGQQRTAASIAEAGLKAQNAAFLEGREANKGQLAGALFDKLFSADTGARLSFGLEKEADRYKRQFVYPFERALNTENIERQRAFEADPRSIQEETRKRKGRMEGEMFKAALPGVMAFGATGPFASLAGKYGFAFGGMS
jgi:hypothetical protein